MLAQSRTAIAKCGIIAKSHSATSKFVQRATFKFPIQYAALRSFAISNEKPTTSSNTNKKDNKLDQQRVSRSILEEVLIKEEEGPKTTAQKVKKGAENTFLYASVVVSVITLAGLAYLVFEYIFSSGSPNRVYSKALKMIRDAPECQRALGDEIAGFGEQSRRSRRHIASQVYKVDDEDRVRVTFHVKGSKNAGRVFVEVFKKPGDSWDYRFLFIELADRSDTIVLIDNRR